MAEQYDIRKHVFVPEHIKLNPAEKKEVLDNFGISFKHLPRILVSDVAIAHLNAKVGDVIKIVRKSKTAGESIFYRGVENE
jgi:DNA-directed RNA polymerase subunit H (RpoH/RPB5)